MSVDVAALVIDNLDLWSGASERKSGTGRGAGKKVSLYGVERLRALILALGVRGKLVPQDVADEPAEQLLARISRERQNAIEQGRTSRSKTLPHTRSGTMSLPTSWASARFGDVFSLEYGDNLPEPKRTGTGEYPVFGSNGVVGTHNIYSVAQPCLVVGRKGSAGAINISHSPSWVTDVAYYCVPPSGVELEYQHILFRTLALSDLGKGIKPGLNRNEASNLTVAIPPTAEQRRIVAKVGELMTLCDTLELLTASELSAHQTLVETLLATLVNATDPTDLASKWVRLNDHFDAIFTSEAAVDHFKQTVLELAVGGKLIAQDDPEGWSAAKLGKLISPMDSGWSPACLEFPARDEQAWGVLKTTAVQRLGFQPEQNKELPASLQPRPNAECRAGDILVTRAGPTNRVGICCYVSSTRPRLMISDKIVRFRPNPGEVDGAYLALALSVGPAAMQIEKAKAGMAASQVNISQVKLREVIVSYPRLPEQLRIVAKVEELMRLCEVLKKKLVDASQTRRQLADAIIDQATA